MCGGAPNLWQPTIDSSLHWEHPKAHSRRLGRGYGGASDTAIRDKPRGRAGQHIFEITLPSYCSVIES
jgi:hypothetical protein